MFPRSPRDASHRIIAQGSKLTVVRSTSLPNGSQSVKSTADHPFACVGLCRNIIYYPSIPRCILSSNHLIFQLNVWFPGSDHFLQVFRILLLNFKTRQVSRTDSGWRDGLAMLMTLPKRSMRWRYPPLLSDQQYRGLALTSSVVVVSPSRPNPP